MASNNSEDSVENNSPETLGLKPPSRSKSRTKSVDELVAKLEEQNRYEYLVRPAHSSSLAVDKIQRVLILISRGSRNREKAKAISV